MEIRLSNRTDRFDTQHKLTQSEQFIQPQRESKISQKKCYAPSFKNIPQLPVLPNKIILAGSQQQLLFKLEDKVQNRSKSSSVNRPQSKNQVQSTVPQSLKILNISENGQQRPLKKFSNPLDLLKSLPSFNFNLSQNLNKCQQYDMFESQYGFEEGSSQEQFDKMRKNEKNIQLIQEGLKKYKQLLTNYYGQYIQKHLNSETQTNKVTVRNNSKKQNHSKKQFFTITRFKFKKIQNKKQFLQPQTCKYIFRYIRSTNRIIRYPVIPPNQNYNQNLIQPQTVFTFKNTLNISPYVQYDCKNNRIICYQNKKGELMIISNKNCQVLCKIQVQQRRYNPLIYIYQKQDETVVLLIGGFLWKKSQTYKRLIAEGSKMIQVFIFDKWSVNLKHKLFKMKIGRCFPLIMTVQSRNSLTSNFENMLYIFGGNALATLKESFGFFKPKSFQSELLKFQKPLKISDLDFSEFKDFNLSTNQTGLLIPFNDFFQEVNDSVDTRSLSVFKKEVPFELDCLSLSINVIGENIELLHSGKILKRTIDQNQQIFLILPGISTLFLIFHQNQHLKIIKTQCNLQGFEKSQGVNDGVDNTSMTLMNSIQASYCQYIDSDGKRMQLKLGLNSKQQRKYPICSSCQIM